MKSAKIILLSIIFSAFFLYPDHALASSIGVPSNALTMNSGLVGWWTFDGKDVVNGVIRDKSGNGNHGNAINIATSTFYDIGKVGQAGRFDGVDDRVMINSDMLGTGTLSVSAWINPKKQSGTITTNTSGNTTFSVDSTSNRLIFSCTSNVRSATNSIPLNRQVFVLVTRDGSGVSNIYINGVLSGTADQNCGTPASGATQTFIGASGSGSGPSSGMIDDVRIYNRALSASEVSQLYNSTAGSKVSASQPVKNRNCTSGLSCGLVGYWTFDGKDVVNGVIRDKSGNGNHGNPINIATSTFYTKGKIGQAGRFDGGDDKIKTGSDLIGATAGTYSAWIYAKSIGQVAGRIFDNNKTIFRLGANIIVLSSNGGTNNAQSAAGSLPYNQWVFVTVTRNGSGIANLYINGQLSGSANQNSGTPEVGTTNMIIGNSNTTDRTFNGLIDDIRIYNRALSASEVSQLYNSTAGSKVSASQPVKNTNCTSGLSCGLVGYWTFDGKDVVNGVIRDKSGQGNHGNPINIASSTFYTKGKVGQAGRFDGGDDYLRISSDITFGDSVPWTFSTWMNWNGVVSGNNSFTGLGGTFKYLGVADSGFKRFVYREGAPNYTVRSFSNNSSVSVINKWQYITIMSDGQGTLSLYKDGVYSEQITSLSTTAIIFRYIGIGYGPTSGLFGGSLDDVRIYNRALSASEVQQLYNMGR